MSKHVDPAANDQPTTSPATTAAADAPNAADAGGEPTKAEAVAAVKKAMLERCKEDKYNPDTLFTETVPACMDDELIYLYSLTRGHDAPSAAKRVMKMVKNLNDLEMKSLTVADDDIAAGLKLGTYFWPTSNFIGASGHPDTPLLPPPTVEEEKEKDTDGSKKKEEREPEGPTAEEKKGTEEKTTPADESKKDAVNNDTKKRKYHLDDFSDKDGHPVMYCYGHNIDWDAVTVRQFQKASIFAMVQMARISQKIQTDGMCFVMMMKDVKMGQIKMEFEKFILKVMQEALPMKYTALYISHEPFFFSHILWPVFKPLMKKKLKERLQWLGSKEKDFAKLLHPAFTEKGVEALPVLLGGKFEFDKEDFFQELLHIHGTVGAYALAEKKKAEAEEKVVNGDAKEEEKKEKGDASAVAESSGSPSSNTEKESE